MGLSKLLLSNKGTNIRVQEMGCGFKYGIQGQVGGDRPPQQFLRAKTLGQIVHQTGSLRQVRTNPVALSQIPGHGLYAQNMLEA
jgi:hypothetical protein